jgi:integrase
LTREASTLRRVAREYHEKKVEPVLSDKHAKQWLASIDREENPNLPNTLLDAPIATIEPAALLDALQPLYQRIPETARRIRQRLDAVFDYAVLRKLAPANPAKIIVRELRSKRAKGSFRALPYGEVPALVKRLRGLPGTAARALEFAVLTAARTGEVLGMEWSEVSANSKVWTVPAERMKGKQAHTVYLSKHAQSVLAQLKGASERWVFPSPVDATKPLSNMAMLVLLRRMNLAAKTTVHGLCRASFSTWAYETNAARPDVIEATLAHKETDRVKAAYNRAKFIDERKALIEAWATFVSRGRGK